MVVNFVVVVVVVVVVVAMRMGILGGAVGAAILLSKFWVAKFMRKTLK